MDGLPSRPPSPAAALGGWALAVLALACSGAGLHRATRPVPARESLAVASGGIEACRAANLPGGRRLLVRLGGNPVDFMLDIPQAGAASVCDGLLSDRTSPLTLLWSPAGFRYRPTPTVEPEPGDRRKFQPLGRAWEIVRGGRPVVVYADETARAVRRNRAAALPWGAGAFAAAGALILLRRRSAPRRLASAEAA